MIDTHCHLYDAAFDDDREAVLQRAVAAGVELMLQPAIDSSSNEAQYALGGPHIRHMAGLHPTSVGDNYRDELQQVERLLASGTMQFVAVGEIGLDYYWDTTYKDQQREALRCQLLMARRCCLPVSLHVRDAYDDLFDLLDAMGYDEWRGVLHCFSGTPRHASMALERGFSLGIGGVVTFKKSALPQIVEQVPIERIVLETDAPYLAPMPYRGKRNESAYLPLIAQRVAEIKGLSLADVDRVTTQNALSLFCRV